MRPATRHGAAERARARSRRRATRVGALLLAVAAGLAGCVGIPTSGPIGTGDAPVDEPGRPVPLADDPVLDAEPQAIVSGFLNAGSAGLADDFATARKYLTFGASDSWDPRARVLVYPEQSRGPQLEERDDGSILVTVPVQSVVDSAGRYAEAVPGARPEEIVFELMVDGAGQWRISGLDDGVVMNASNFDSLYRRAPVYFASKDGTHLVPDLRWFATTKTATLAAAALLEGPSPWLRDAVTSGAPEGVRLSTDAVPVSETGVALVDLAADAALADQGSRNLLQAQLEATLEGLPGTAISAVEVTVGGVPWEATQVPELLLDVVPASGPYVLQDERLAVVVEGEVVPVEDAWPLTGLSPSSPAVSPDESLRVVLAGLSRLLLLPASAEPVTLLTGTRLVPPSIDRFGWVWTGETISHGTLTAVAADREVLTVAADWLEGRAVRSVRVSRDGTRVAVVSAGASPEDVVIDVAGVVRDEEGRPQSLGGTEEPLRVGAALTDATELAWVDEVTLAVLGTSGGMSNPTMHLVPVGGPTRALATVEGTVGIAAGRGERALYLVDAEHALLSKQGTSWKTVATDVRDPVFPG
ncbi:LpqB family beta-propeller domain-containing protein [Actinotalea subterranea]|uniref:LpqB family beta-propeller domain-containing protein n=1 Tax=Actinotalea subterranea TaxID=2607497 RepID=UPI0011EDDB46|nr:LpqB family beta-propeller domain-containing protein [Actinotalea subterranea]